MASGGTLVGEWSRAAKSALVAAGWTKRGGTDIFTRDLDDDTLAWVGLNRNEVHADRHLAHRWRPS